MTNEWSGKELLKCGPTLVEQVSPATRAELERCGFNSVYALGDLLQFKRSELARKRGMSLAAINEVEALLAVRGLKLGAKLENWPPQGVI